MQCSDKTAFAEPSTTLCAERWQRSGGLQLSRKVVGKSARDNPERYCGWFWVNCSSKKFERMAREAMDVCLRVLKESNKSRFDSYSVRNSVLIISHITFRDCRVHSFCDNLPRNSCVYRIELDSHVCDSEITRKEMQDAVDDAGLNRQEKNY